MPQHVEPIIQGVSNNSREQVTMGSDAPPGQQPKQGDKGPEEKVNQNTNLQDYCRGLGQYNSRC